MATSVQFPDLLQLIDERAVALRAAVTSAPSLEVQVPTCPEWTLLELVHHLGNSHRRWAATVAAGPADTPPDETVWRSSPTPPADRDALLGWSKESTTQLLSALCAAGADRSCWTWWDAAQSPSTSGAVARHQLQHIAVHTYDAQITVGDPQPLPDETAVDGVEEFLFTCCSGTDPWPHEPCAVDYQATEGRSWRLSLSTAGARTTPIPAEGSTTTSNAAASLRGTASDLVLVMYGRIPISSLQGKGDVHIFDQLLAWDPDAP
jgi:uncharacterized protein (TIGR03083 family)